MAAVKHCFTLTKQLYDLVNETVEEEDRDEQIRQIDLLLSQREEILPEIQPPFSAEEKELGRQIVGYNQLIDTKLKSLRTRIQVDFQQVKKKEQSVQKYTNPYEALQTDGVFYDKKN
ncbi:hypothetical protein [Sporosarcina sp. HYO08]|uniref:hypothetical protein n=1 Tax=Sporosarcina sp. HYO08 TaxID=1759557 RepID=UPI0007928540|nr:hypothetical protein [Sporosarcina sp. HYO08]KXH79732.1 hypothetical protein AU377_09575 [Sporosarcina sp. HYO08]